MKIDNLPLTCIYAKLYDKEKLSGGESLNKEVMSVFKKYNNVNILLSPDVKYKTEEKLQDENESATIHNMIKQELDNANIECKTFCTTNNEEIFTYVKENIDNLLK